MGEIHKLITVYDVLSTVHNKRRVLGGMAHCQLLPEGQSEESAPQHSHKFPSRGATP